MVELLAEAAIVKPGLKSAFAINRKVVNTPIGREVIEALAVYGVRVLQASLAQRVAFAESAGHGCTVFDLDPTSTARWRPWRGKFWSIIVAKKVLIPHPHPLAKPDGWVTQKPVEAGEPTKRLTIDIPQALHTRIKTTCAANQQKMADAVRALLEQHWPEAA